MDLEEEPATDGRVSNADISTWEERGVEMRTSVDGGQQQEKNKISGYSKGTAPMIRRQRD
jgi:hypothetical protein